MNGFAAGSCSAGTFENSPAFQCRVEFFKRLSPEGTVEESQAIAQSSLRDSFRPNRVPALKRRAIFKRPLRDWQICCHSLFICARSTARRWLAIDSGFLFSEIQPADLLNQRHEPRHFHRITVPGKPHLPAVAGGGQTRAAQCGTV